MIYPVIFCLISFIVIGLLLILYITIATKRRLTIRIERKEYHCYAVVGAGIVFPITFLVLLVIFSNNYIHILIGTLLISAVSFIDDVIELPVSTRLLVHIVAAILLTADLNYISNNSFLIYTILLVILIVSYVNATNFMDGINGMLVINSLISLLVLIIINAEFNFTDEYILFGLSIACLIFGYGNFRKAPLFISGDVGSISLGFIIIWCSLKLYIATINPMSFLLISVFLIETGGTLFESFFRKRNILTSHKNHMYEKLVYRDNFADIKVSCIYGFTHLLICGFVWYCITYAVSSLFVLGISFLILTFTYYIFKIFIIK